MKYLFIVFIFLTSLISGRVVADPIVYVHIEGDVNLIRCAYNASVLLGIPIEVDSTIHGQRIIDGFVWVESMERDDTTYVIVTEDDMHKYNADKIGEVDMADLIAMIQFMFK